MTFREKRTWSADRVRSMCIRNDYYTKMLLKKLKLLVKKAEFQHRYILPTLANHLPCLTVERGKLMTLCLPDMHAASLLKTEIRGKSKLNHFRAETARRGCLG